jgi:hypothetical protein
MPIAMSVNRRIPCIAAVIAVLAGTGFPVSSRAQSGCSIELSRTEIDYGTLNRSDILARQNYRENATLGSRTALLTVDCPAEQPMRISVRAPGNMPEGFGFGEKGHMLVVLSEGRIDGIAVGFMPMNNATQALPTGAGLQLVPGMSYVPVIEGAPIQGRHLTATLTIDPKMPYEATHVSDITHWAGQIIFDLSTP